MRARQCLRSLLSLVTELTQGLEPWTQAHVDPQDVNGTSGSFNALTCWSTRRTPKPRAMAAKPNPLCRAWRGVCSVGAPCPGGGGRGSLVGLRPERV